MANPRGLTAEVRAVLLQDGRTGSEPDDIERVLRIAYARDIGGEPDAYDADELETIALGFHLNGAVIESVDEVLKVHRGSADLGFRIIDG